MRNELRSIVIIGAGGQGVVVADLLQRAHEAGSPATPIGFLDDVHPQGSDILGLPVLGSIGALQHLDCGAVVIAIGDNRARRTISDRVSAAGIALATAIHPRASVAPSATIAEGAVICAGAVIDPRVTIGRGVIINMNATVAHDSVVEEFAHVSAGSIVGARVHIGAESLIAIGAMVVSKMRVGARTVIGAGAVVVEDIGDDVVAFGVPARVRSEKPL